MLLTFMYYYTDESTHFAENRITLPPPSHVCSVLKGMWTVIKQQIAQLVGYCSNAYKINKM